MSQERQNNIFQDLKNNLERKEKGYKEDSTKNREEHTHKTDTAAPTHITLYHFRISKTQGSQWYSYLPLQNFLHKDMTIRTPHEKMMQNEQEYIH